MFGYIQADKSELKVKSYKLYRAYYCGLCRTLQKKYGFFTKFLLNYDCTFVALLLSLLEEDTELIRSRCPFNPLRSEMMADISPAMEFAAALNVIFAYQNLLDKWLDDRNITARVLAFVYSGAYKKARRNYPETVAATENAMDLFHRSERENCADIDISAGLSAEILSRAVATYDFSDDVTAHITVKMFEDIGKWVYIADAWDDRKRDAKKGSFNPVNLSGMSREETKHLLYTCLSGAEDAFALLDIKKGRAGVDIAENILGTGCVLVTEAVLDDAFRTKYRRRTYESI